MCIVEKRDVKGHIPSSLNFLIEGSDELPKGGSVTERISLTSF